MSLDPVITRDPATGKCTLLWRRDPAAAGYVIETPTGSALAGAGKTSSNLGVHDSITASVTPLYPDPAQKETASYPAPPSGGAWAWDATKATVLANSVASVADFMANGYPGSPTLSCDVAVVDSGRSGDPTPTAYIVTGAKTANYDTHVFGPPGVKAGSSSDKHLVIRDHANGREHDFWEAAPSGGDIGSGGGGSFALDAVQEPIGKWSNAARFPLARTAITAAEVKAGRITHALEFCAKQAWIGGPSVFPADGTSSGPGHGWPFGQWVRLPASLDITGLPALERLIAQALKDYGMFLRDGGNYNLAISGVDYVNQGGNTSVWGAAGVTLTAGWYRSLGAIPWAKLEALAPPAKA